MRWFFFFFTSLFLVGCVDSSFERKEGEEKKKGAITRYDADYLFQIALPRQTALPTYSWREDAGRHPKITKEFFRCRGSGLHPLKRERGGAFFDCGGSDDHTLPIVNGEEFIYPILIEILNDLQTRSGRQIAVTSGHHCPLHDTYLDPKRQRKGSRYQIGAAVDFYIKGWEYSPEKTLASLKAFYQEESDKKWRHFSSVIEGKKWSNREIMITLYREEEGRNEDNRHPFPYFTIEVLYDRIEKKRVFYTWYRGFKGYFRR